MTPRLVTEFGAEKFAALVNDLESLVKAFLFGAIRKSKLPATNLESVKQNKKLYTYLTLKKEHN